MSKKRNLDWLENKCFLATYDDIRIMPDCDGKPNYIINCLFPYTLANNSKHYEEMIEGMKSERKRHSKGLALIEVKKIYATTEHTEARLREIEIEIDNLLKERDAIRGALRCGEK